MLSAVFVAKWTTVNFLLFDNNFNCIPEYFTRYLSLFDQFITQSQSSFTSWIFTELNLRKYMQSRKSILTSFNKNTIWPDTSWSSAPLSTWKTEDQPKNMILNSSVDMVTATSTNGCSNQKDAVCSTDNGWLNGTVFGLLVRTELTEQSSWAGKKTTKTKRKIGLIKFTDSCLSCCSSWRIWSFWLASASAFFLAFFKRNASATCEAIIIRQFPHQQYCTSFTTGSLSFSISDCHQRHSFNQLFSDIFRHQRHCASSTIRSILPCHNLMICWFEPDLFFVRIIIGKKN